MKLPLSDIVVPERQRRDLGDLHDLDSMADPTIGQLQAIGVNEKNELLWGGRRLAKARLLGWPDIEVVVRPGLTPGNSQLIELYENIARKNLTWQENCLAVAKIYRLKELERALTGDHWTEPRLVEWAQQNIAQFSGHGASSIRMVLAVAKEIASEPGGPVAKAPNYTEATKQLYGKALSPVEQELERRRQEKIATGGVESVLPSVVSNKPETTAAAEPLAPPTLALRAEFYNSTYPHLPPLTVHDDADGQFLYGFWFLGGGRHSDFYGAYHTEYLARAATLFPDLKQVVHLFSGSLPPGPYIRVGKDPKYKPDIEGDAEQLSSFLSFHPDLIYADPPYTRQEAEDEYQISLVNGPKVVSECAKILKPGGFLVWLDQRLPVFSNDEIRWVGCISYVRSTGNRFRCVCLFQKPL